MPYSTQTDLERYLQIDFTADPDPTVTRLLTWAQAAIDNYIGYPLAAATGIVETHSPDGAESVMLKRAPVTAITSVVEDGQTLTVDVDYVWFANGILMRGSKTGASRWTHSRNGVVVTYDAGYATIPEDVVLISTEIAARMFTAAAARANVDPTMIGVQSISLAGSDSVKFAEAVNDVVGAAVPLSDRQRAVLDRYRREPWL